jgi:hypothetical protein
VIYIIFFAQLFREVKSDSIEIIHSIGNSDGSTSESLVDFKLAAKPRPGKDKCYLSEAKS